MSEALKSIVVSLYNNLTLANFNSLASSFAYIAATYVGIKGLSAWKAQLKGNQEYKLAKKLMLQIYKYQQAMYQLRSPAIWEYEYPQYTEEELQMLGSKRQFKQVSHAYQKRWDNVENVRPKIYELTLEAQVHWGDKIKQLIEDMLRTEKKVFFAISRYIRALNPDVTKEDITRKEYVDWMYDSGEEDNDIYRKAFIEKLKQVEDYLKPKLKL